MLSTNSATLRTPEISLNLGTLSLYRALSWMHSITAREKELALKLRKLSLSRSWLSASHFRQLWDWSPPSSDHAPLQTCTEVITQLMKTLKNQCPAETRDTEMLLCSQVIDLKKCIWKNDGIAMLKIVEWLLFVPQCVRLLANCFEFLLYMCMSTWEWHAHMHTLISELTEIGIEYLAPLE